MTNFTMSANSPRTISLDIASVVPNSFFILTLTSPLSFLWHLIIRSLLLLQDVSILTFGEGESRSSSLYHCIFIGSPPENGSFHSAFSPALIMTGFEKFPRSSLSIFGGSLILEKEKACEICKQIDNPLVDSHNFQFFFMTLYIKCGF